MVRTPYTNTPSQPLFRDNLFQSRVLSQEPPLLSPLDILRAAYQSRWPKPKPNTASTPTQSLLQTLLAKSFGDTPDPFALRRSNKKPKGPDPDRLRIGNPNRLPDNFYS